MTTGSDTPRVESWRVVTQAAPGSDQTSDATVRLSAGGHRVVVNGEGRWVADALESGLATALQELAALGVTVPDDARELLREQVHAPAPEPASTRLLVTAVHDAAMLTRLTSRVGLHDVDHFSYRTTADGLAHVVIGVRGDDWQVRRAASRLERTIGVVDVLVENV